MGDYQAGARVVTMAMREAGADVLSDSDLSCSREELAEVVYTAMELARQSGTSGRPGEPRLFGQKEQTRPSLPQAPLYDLVISESDIPTRLVTA